MEHMDELPVMVVQVTADFLIADINQAVTDKLGYVLEEATGRPVLDFMTEQTQALARDRVQGEQSVQAVPYSLLAKSGQVVETEMSVNRQVDSQGQHLKSFAVMHDVTRRNQLFRRRDQMREALEKSNQELVNLTGVMANDLEAALQRIDQLLSTIEPAIQDSDPAVTNYVNMAGQSIQQMQGLVAGLLSLLQINPTPLKTQEVDLQQLVMLLPLSPDVVDMSDVNLNILAPLPTVTVTSDCLAQVLQELVVNAVKFRNPEASLNITVSAEMVDEDGGHWQVSIRDNGLGFPAELNHQVFEPLSRFHSGRDPSGLGLGLARAVRLLRQIRGTISVVSQAGAGANFIIRFPHIATGGQS
jgi:PAS domain S-box-containing protein